MSFHDIGAAEVGAVGVGYSAALYSAALPLLGAILGWIKFSAGTKDVEFDLKHRYIKVMRGMLLVCVVFGFVVACVIQYSLSGHDGFVPSNAALAAGYINGASSCVTAICMGWFGCGFTHAGFRQPKLFIGGILVMVFIEAFALYGFIVSLVIMVQAEKAHLDMAPGAVVPFASIDILANAGGAFGAAACGLAIMEVAVEHPDMVMRMMITVTPNGYNGIFGLISSIMDTRPFPPSGNDWWIGIFYLLSSVGLAYVGFSGVQCARIPDSIEYKQMIKQLMVMRSIGFAGLVSGLFMHHPEGAVALLVASMVGAAAYAMRSRQSGQDLDAPLMES